MRGYVESGRARRHVGAVKKSSQFAIETFGPMVTQGVAAHTELKRTSFVPASRTSVHAIGRSLATEPSALTVAQIQDRLMRLMPAETHPVPVEQILKSNPAFVESPVGFWWLGRLRIAARSAT